MVTIKAFLVGLNIVIVFNFFFVLTVFEKSKLPKLEHSLTIRLQMVIYKVMYVMEIRPYMGPLFFILIWYQLFDFFEEKGPLTVGRYRTNGWSFQLEREFDSRLVFCRNVNGGHTDIRSRL